MFPKAGKPLQKLDKELKLLRKNIQDESKKCEGEKAHK